MSYEKHAEAACCIWEALLDVVNLREIPDATSKAIREAFEQRGTNEMRHAAIALSVLCSQTWDELAPDERPDCFDWDYVPAFVASLTWDANTSTIVAIPDLEGALSQYRAFVAKEGHPHDAACQHRNDGRGRCIDCGGFI